MAVTHVAAYDVCEDQRRARLAALLQAYGDRIQKSVFLISADAEALAAIAAKSAGIIDERTDSLWIMRQCAPCWEVVEQVGQASPPSLTRYWAVM